MAADSHRELHRPRVSVETEAGKGFAGLPHVEPVKLDTVTVDSEFQARQLADQGKLAEAQLVCARALIKDKLNPGLHFLNSAILLELQRDEEAGASLRRALYIDPKFVMAHYALGNLFLRRRNTQAAQKSFENALSLLAPFGEGDPVPEAEGLTAKRLGEIIHASMEAGISP